MVLFGNEFDADKRAEVGGGYGRIIETENSDVSANLRERVFKPREKGRENVCPIGMKQGCDFIFYHRIRLPTRHESSRIPR
jgi:hypothetical protein